MPAASCRGFSATTICIVEQFGLATIPRWPSSASGLTSETTSGTSSAMRHFEELSTTTAPAPGPLGGCVTHAGPRLHEARRPLAGRRAAGAEDRDVEALDGVVVQRLDDEAAVELAAGRALGRERDDLARGERPLAQEAQHDAANLPGRADDGDAVAVAGGHAANSPNGCSGRIVPSPESSNAVWSALTASGTRSPGTTQEMRIGEVEIISMLMPLSPSVVNTLAATPGWVFIPAPTIETFPIEGSVASVMPSSDAIGSSAVRAACTSSRGTVNDMSARRPSVSGSPWTIMSMFTLASPRAGATRPAP